MTQDNFKQTVYILKDEMYRFAKRFVMSSDEAEDVVQDLMMMVDIKGTIHNLDLFKAVMNGYKIDLSRVQ